MSETVISVENISKRYFIGAKKELPKTKGEAIRSIVGAPFKYLSSRAKEPNPKETFWALKDVSFEVKAGEVVGLIGRNGAGKSTLLKILSRITKPSSGCVKIRGRVGSLLEVGTGFHPELTGRENIYLNGTILGMTKKEIDKKFDKIVDFSSIEKFLDTPVKRYSSGMYVKLAFAVAAHLESDILVLDEILAVGDVAFQKKCLGKMGEIATEQGKTVIFVSHDMSVIKSFTSTCLYLCQGKIDTYAKTDCVVKKYLEDSFDYKSLQLKNLDYYQRELTKDSPVYIVNMEVNNNSILQSKIELFQDIKVKIELKVKEKLKEANINITIKDIKGDKITILFSWNQNFSLTCLRGQYLIEVDIKDLPLVQGQYLADIGVNQSTNTKAYDVLINVPFTEIVNNGQVVHWLERPWGILHCNKTNWTIKKKQYS